MSDQEQMQLPRYRCHKIVNAAKITAINWTTPIGNQVKIEFDDIDGSVMVETSWIDRFNPKVGGYYVVYEDGYTSFSPAKAFEDGYTRI